MKLVDVASMITSPLTVTVSKCGWTADSSAVAETVTTGKVTLSMKVDTRPSVLVETADRVTMEAVRV